MELMTLDHRSKSTVKALWTKLECQLFAWRSRPRTDAPPAPRSIHTPAPQADTTSVDRRGERDDIRRTSDEGVAKDAIPIPSIVSLRSDSETWTTTKSFDPISPNSMAQVFQQMLRCFIAILLSFEQFPNSQYPLKQYTEQPHPSPCTASKDRQCNLF